MLVGRYLLVLNWKDKEQVFSGQQILFRWELGRLVMLLAPELFETEHEHQETRFC